MLYIDKYRSKISRKDTYIMNYESYMTMTAKLTPMSETIDPDTGVRKKGTKRDIKCFIYGKTKMYRNANGEATVSEQTAITMEQIHVGDLINGREVKSVQQYNEFDGTGTFYEVLL